MTEIARECTEMHRTWCERTRQSVTLSPERQRAWMELYNRGIRAADVDLLCRWTLRQVARQEGGFSELSLQFRVMISDPDRFEDRLSLARKTRLAQPVQPAPTFHQTSDRPKPEDEDAIRRQVAGGLAEFRNRLAGG